MKGRKMVLLASIISLSSLFSMAASAKDNTPPPGFKALFNGRNLKGWHAGIPLKDTERGKLTKSELAARQREADEKFLPQWTVRNGLLHFEGKGTNLVTVKDYGDFELWVDWKTGPMGDSGIYLRGCPQVQIWDPASRLTWARNPSGLLICPRSYRQSPGANVSDAA